ncbi:hypothetical protein, partial [Desulfovibrio sp. 1214_IL3152]|uniref:hypothetical protein n=1 Tax=Desulfovibrio sp. 1214_IL3152 TaxID=3084056 RepID=UPI002FD8C094
MQEKGHFDKLWNASAALRPFRSALFLANPGPLRQSTAGAKSMLLRIFSAASGSADPAEAAAAPLVELTAAP